MNLPNFVTGQWKESAAAGEPLLDPVTGEELARISSQGIDVNTALEFARTEGGTSLRKFSYRERADLLAKIADVLARKQEGLPVFVHAHPDETVAAAIAILREYNVSQLPVMKEEPPVMVAEVIGSVVERDLLDALVSGRARPEDPVGEHMSAPLPMVGSGEQVSSAIEALEKAGAAVVLVDGRPAGMITRQDVLTYLAGPA